MTGEGDRELVYAAVTYGDRTIDERPNADRVTLDERIDDIQDAAHEDPGQVTYLLRDAADHETRKESVPDEQAPDLSVRAEPADTAGEIVLYLEGRDDTGLGTVRAGLAGEEVLEEDLSGRQEAALERTAGSDAAEPMAYNSVGAQLRDWNGNRTGKSLESYVRKYDLLEDPALDIGVVYFPMGSRMFTNCLPDDVEPEVNDYGTNPIPPETVTKHIDQMQGHGITRVLPSWGGSPWRYMYAGYTESDLYDEVTVDPFYWIARDDWTSSDSVKENVVHPRLDTFREEMMATDAAATHDGRPTFTLGNASLLADPDIRDTVQDEWGGYDAFVDDLRSRLTVDGTEIFLVTCFPGFESYNPRLRDIARPFDGVTTWVGAGAWGEDDQATWDEARSFVEDMYGTHRDFTDDHGMEFIPTVFPGFDDRANTCWGPDRYTPRSPDHLAELLDLADQYRTTDMINIATWNDWTEGTQIEPGTYRGEDYDTAYLDVVKEFQEERSG
jgi:hypothetical protein